MEIKLKNDRISRELNNILANNREISQICWKIMHHYVIFEFGAAHRCANIKDLEHLRFLLFGNVRAP